MKAFIQWLLRPLGLRLTRLKSTSEVDFGARVLFTTLKSFGFSPRCIVDVGANHGNWTRAALAYFPTAQYVLIEPQDQLKAHIKDLIDSGSAIRWINAGVADKPGRMPFYISQRDDSSTFIRQEPQDHSPASSEVVMEVKTLDQILSENNLPVPDMVKIDAEGFDLKVLQGATRLLGKTDVFLLEAGVVCPLDNSVAKVIAAMESFGYGLLDITELNRSPKYGVLWLTELVFLRKSSQLLEPVTSYE